MELIIKEVIGIKKKLVKLIAKLLPMIKYHICTAYKVKEQHNSRNNDKVAETGQEYVISSNIC